MRIAFYSHDTYGLGHLRRSLKIAGAVAERFPAVRGLIITGSPWADLFPPPPGFRYRRLLPVVKVGPGSYETRAGGVDFERALEERGLAIEAALAELQPDLFVVDNVPCGLAGELHRVLDRARRPGSPRIVLASRDIIDTPEAVRAQWEALGAYEALERAYDEIWVFGDAAAGDWRAEYGVSAAVAERTVFCGPVGSGRPAEARSARRPTARTVLVTGGGGGDAAALVRHYADALAQAAAPTRSEIVLGPDFPEAEIPADLDPRSTEIVRFCRDLPGAIARADAVVAMAGYNTTCEILEAGTPAVFVPRVWPRQEQWLRARALADRGLAQCLHPDEATPERLWRAVERALAEDRRPWTRQWGAQVAAERCVKLVEERHDAA